MHHYRLCAVLIDCRTSDVDEAARFWSKALGRPMDRQHPGSRGNYRMLETAQALGQGTAASFARTLCARRSG
jgi:hypothetical protein